MGGGWIKEGRSIGEVCKWALKTEDTNKEKGYQEGTEMGECIQGIPLDRRVKRAKWRLGRWKTDWWLQKVKSFSIAYNREI